MGGNYPDGCSAMDIDRHFGDDTTEKQCECFVYNSVMPEGKRYKRCPNTENLLIVNDTDLWCEDCAERELIACGDCGYADEACQFILSDGDESWEVCPECGSIEHTKSPLDVLPKWTD